MIYYMFRRITLCMLARLVIHDARAQHSSPEPYNSALWDIWNDARDRHVP